jgi:hypothetical protein
MSRKDRLKGSEMKARVSVIDLATMTSKAGNQYQVLQCFATLQEGAGIAELRVFDPSLFVDGDGDFVADWQIGVDRETKDIAPRVAYLQRVEPGKHVDFGVSEEGIAARFSALTVKTEKSKKSGREYQILEGVCHTAEGRKLVGVLRIFDEKLFVAGPGEYGLEWVQSRSWDRKELGGRLAAVKPLAGVQSLAAQLMKGQKPKAKDIQPA